LVFVAFFFQAEDGIRDFHVTGVQTCALPIYSPLATWRPYHSAESCIAPGLGVEIFYRHSPADEADIAPGLFRRHAEAYATPRTRSEERRVGKSVDLGGRSMITKITERRLAER